MVTALMAATLTRAGTAMAQEEAAGAGEGNAALTGVLVFVFLFVAIVVGSMRQASKNERYFQKVLQKKGQEKAEAKLAARRKRQKQAGVAGVLFAVLMTGFAIVVQLPTVLTRVVAIVGALGVGVLAVMLLKAKK